jgi:8-oxo-dGTP pyrophosphatase MutT (NUDIX family)
LDVGAPNDNERVPRPRPPVSGPREVSAGGVVFRRTLGGPEFALIKANGRWGFPKGNIEKDETPEVTALREIAEETGLPINRLRILSQLPPVKYAFRWEGDLIFKTVHHYLVELEGEAALNPQLSEIDEARWFTPGAAPRALGFKNSQETLDHAIAGIEAAVAV